MHYIRPFLLSDKVASLVFGKAGVHLAQSLGVLAIGVELLQLHPQASALGREVNVADIRLSGTCA